MRKSLLKTIAATAIVGVTMALSSVAAWAATEITWGFTELSDWENSDGASVTADKGKTYATLASNKTNTSFFSKKNVDETEYILEYVANNDKLNDKGSLEVYGLNMNGNSTASLNRRIIKLSVPANATVSLTAWANGSGKEDNLSYIWGTGSVTKYNEAIKTSSTVATTFTLKNDNPTTQLLTLGFESQKQIITSVTLSIPTPNFQFEKAVVEGGNTYVIGSIPADKITGVTSVGFAGKSTEDAANAATEARKSTMTVYKGIKLSGSDSFLAGDETGSDGKLYVAFKVNGDLVTNTTWVKAFTDLASKAAVQVTE